MPERPVRIPRAPRDSQASEYSEAPEPAPAPRRLGPPVSEAITPWISNRGALDRSVRLFLSFLVIPGVLWGFFFLLERTSADPALRTDLIGPAVMGAIWLAIAVLGFLLTLQRTPRAFRQTGRGDLAYLPVFGSQRIQRLGEGARRVIREHYSPNPLNPSDVDLVEILVPGLPKRLWLVESERVEELLPR